MELLPHNKIPEVSQADLKSTTTKEDIAVVEDEQQDSTLQPSFIPSDQIMEMPQTKVPASPLASIANNTTSSTTDQETAQVETLPHAETPAKPEAHPASVGADAAPGQKIPPVEPRIRAMTYSQPSSTIVKIALRALSDNNIPVVECSQSIRWRCGEPLCLGVSIQISS